MGSPEPASPAVVVGALETLQRAPMRAPLTLTPGARASTELAGWHEATRLTQTPFVTRLARAYSADLDTDHLAVGGACGLQHYAGRFALAALGVWVQTGCLPDLDPGAWQLELDERGHTITIAPPIQGSHPAGDAHAAADAVLRLHLAPMIAATREATRITERVALGCIAASCSGAFSTFHRGAAPQDQEAFAAVAVAFLSARAWQSDRPLVDLSRITVDAGAALVHERRVCCLIRLGRGHGACGTCPDLDPAERRRRITDHANRAPRGADLHLGVDHVP